MGALAKEDEDEGCPVEYLRIQFSFEGAVLARGQFEVKEHGVTIVKAHQFGDLLYLARTEQSTGMGTYQALYDAFDAGYPCCSSQLCQLVQRFLNGPISAGHIYANQDSTLGSTGKQGTR